MEHAPWWRQRPGIVLVGFLAIAGFFLWTEHRAHLLGILPFALLAACPLMHLFMHHGHGHGHEAEKHGDADLKPGSSEEAHHGA